MRKEKLRKRRLRRSHLHDGALLLSMASGWLMTPTSLVIGGVVFVVGFAVQVWSKAALRRNRELSRRGPYALCRHPFYLGNALFDLSLCLMSGNWALVALYPFAFYWAYSPTILKEELYTRKLFGAAHRDYCRTTCLIFPFTKRFWADWRTPLSWRVLLAEKEVSRGIRHLSYPLLIWISWYLLRNPKGLEVAARVKSAMVWQGVWVAVAFVTSALVHRWFERAPAAQPES